MIDSLKPQYRPLSVSRSKLRDSGLQKVEPHSDSPSPHGRLWKGSERRRGGDRRNRMPKPKQSNFDMRHLRGRRRSDRKHPRIETKA